MEDNSPQVAKGHEHERIVMMTLFSAVCVTYLTQIYTRVTTSSSSHRQRWLDLKNSKSVNHFCGTLASFWAVIAWIDLNQVFNTAAPGLIEFAFTAAWSSMASAVVLNISIAVHSLAQSEPNNNKRSVYDFWFCVRLFTPWVCGAVMSIMQVALDRNWPFIIWSSSGIMVLLTSTLQLVLVRRRVISHVIKSGVNSNVNVKANERLATWKQFTRMINAVAMIGSAFGLLHTTLLLKDLDRPLAYSNAEVYTLRDGGIGVIAGVCLLAQILVMMWFSWTPPKFWSDRKAQQQLNGIQLTFTSVNSIQINGSQHGALNSKRLSTARAIGSVSRATIIEATKA